MTTEEEAEEEAAQEAAEAATEAEVAPEAAQEADPEVDQGAHEQPTCGRQPQPIELMLGSMTRTC